MYVLYNMLYIYVVYVVRRMVEPISEDKMLAFTLTRVSDSLNFTLCATSGCKKMKGCKKCVKEMIKKCKGKLF